MSDTMSVQVLSEAADLQKKKSADYQNPNSNVVQADYYPNGITTIQDIVWAKTLRARSILEAGNTPNFESLEDTYKDLINYASFAVAWLRGQVPGQSPTRDMYNRPTQSSGADLEQGLAKALDSDLSTPITSGTLAVQSDPSMVVHNEAQTQ